MRYMELTIASRFFFGLLKIKRIPMIIITLGFMGFFYEFHSIWKIAEWCKQRLIPLGKLKNATNYAMWQYQRWSCGATKLAITSKIYFNKT